MTTTGASRYGTEIVVVGVGDWLCDGDCDGVGVGEVVVGVCDGEGEGDDGLADGVGRAFGRASETRVSAASSMEENRASVTCP